MDHARKNPGHRQVMMSFPPSIQNVIVQAMLSGCPIRLHFLLDQAH